MASSNQPLNASLFKPVGIANLTSTLCHQSSVIQAVFRYSPFLQWLQTHHYKCKQVVLNKRQSSPFVEYKAAGCIGPGCEACCEVQDCVVCALCYVFQSYRHLGLEDRSGLRGEFTLELERLLYSENGAGNDYETAHQDVTETFQRLGQGIFDAELVDWNALGKMFGRVSTQETRKCPNPQCQSVVSNHVSGDFGYPCHFNQVIRKRNEFADVPLEQMLDRAWSLDTRVVRCPNESCWASRVRSYGPVETPFFVFPIAAELPDMFCARILRYDHIRSGPREGIKVCWPVTIPSQLSLDDYVYQRAVKGITYSLFAVVSHNGEMGGGHYKTIVRGSDEQWFEIDDEKVSLLASRTNFDYFFENNNGYPPAAEAAWSLANWTPCMAFYRRLDSNK